MTMVVSIVLGGMALGSRQRVHMFHRQTNRTMAMSISEAGLNLAFVALSENLDLADATNPILSNSDFSGGEYEVHVSRPEGTNDTVLMLTSIGRYRNQERTSIATAAFQVSEDSDAEEGGTTVLGPFGAAALLSGSDLSFSGGVDVNLYELGAHANGNVDFGGGPSLSGSYLSTNGNMDMSGNPTLILGNGSGILHADGSVTLRGTINAAQISSSIIIYGNWGTNTGATHIAPEVSYPESYTPNVSIQDVPNVQIMTLPPLDWEAFRTHAQAHDYYYEGKQNINRSWLTKDIKARTGENVYNNKTKVAPAGGVMFVDGDVTLNSDMEMNGTIVATGNITVNGAATFSNPNTYPALVSVNGNIRVTGGAHGLSENGWIYAMNGSVFAGGGASTMTGLVAAQDVNIVGGFDIGNATNSGGFTWPGQDTGGGDDGASGKGDVILKSWIR
ncbi:MAG: hypothetical protein PF795_12665 [Kiritimatiellae bacterium]|nr:hypothetical protein [Kiritimatiellia bacterium]